MSAKQIVQDFYTSDFFNDTSNIEKYLHKDAELHWNASSGYAHFKKDQMHLVFSEAGKSFDEVRCGITHLLEDGDTASIRFTYFAKTIESPQEEIPLGHFIAIWEVKDGLLYKGFQMSQQPEDSPEALDSFKA